MSQRNGCGTSGGEGGADAPQPSNGATLTGAISSDIALMMLSAFGGGAAALQQQQQQQQQQQAAAQTAHRHQLHQLQQNHAGLALDLSAHHGTAASAASPAASAAQRLGGEGGVAGPGSRRVGAASPSSSSSAPSPHQKQSPPTSGSSVMLGRGLMGTSPKATRVLVTVPTRNPCPPPPTHTTLALHPLPHRLLRQSFTRRAPAPAPRHISRLSSKVHARPILHVLRRNKASDTPCIMPPTTPRAQAQTPSIPPSPPPLPQTSCCPYPHCYTPVLLFLAFPPPRDCPLPNSPNPPTHRDLNSLQKHIWTCRATCSQRRCRHRGQGAHRPCRPRA